MKTLNLNARVRVKLTERGRQAHAEHYRALFSHVDDKLTDRWTPELRDDGVYETELWSLMQVFGSSLGMGFIDVFESTELEILP